MSSQIIIMIPPQLVRWNYFKYRNVYRGFIAVKASFNWLIFLSFWEEEFWSKTGIEDCAWQSDDGKIKTLGIFWLSSWSTSRWLLFVTNEAEEFWLIAWIWTCPVSLLFLLGNEGQFRNSWLELWFKGSFCILIAGGCCGDTTSDEDGASSLFKDICGSFVIYCV